MESQIQNLKTHAQSLSFLPGKVTAPNGGDSGPKWPFIKNVGIKTPLKLRLKQINGFHKLVQTLLNGLSDLPDGHKTKLPSRLCQCTVI
jgi:hypothetical protein